MQSVHFPEIMLFQKMLKLIFLNKSYGRAIEWASGKEQLDLVFSGAVKLTTHHNVQVQVSLNISISMEFIAGKLTVTIDF